MAGPGQARTAEHGLTCPLPQAPLLVGFSGGLDSTVLLHRLLRQRRTGGHETVRAIHVHHGLQPEADDWAEHCRRLCADWDIPLQVVHVAVDRGSGLGLEAAARAARYAAFHAAMRNDDVLVLAHQRDDQAETFLLRALRASSLDGLRGMTLWRRFDPGWLWRPLLQCSRAQLLIEAQHHRLHWIDDPSNARADADRNFLRLQVLPLLRQRWPQADAALARSADLAAEAAALLQEQDQADLARVCEGDSTWLSVPALTALPAARQARVLRAWVFALHLPPIPARGIDAVLGTLLHARADAEAAFAWSGVRIARWRDRLHAGPIPKPLSRDWQVSWSGEQPLPLPTGGLLQLIGAPGFDAPLQVHGRRGGERIRLPGRGHHHALKQVLQTLDIPPWERRQMPLLSDADGRLLAAGDGIVSAAFGLWLGQTRASLRWRPAAAA